MRAQELVYVYASQAGPKRIIAFAIYGPAIYPENGNLVELFTLTEREHAEYLQTQEQFNAACEYHGFDGTKMKYDKNLLPF